MLGRALMPSTAVLVYLGWASSRLIGRSTKGSLAVLFSSQIARVRLVLGVVVALGGAFAFPAAGLAVVTSIAAGEGIALSPNPLTSTGTVSLALPLALSDPLSGYFLSLRNSTYNSAGYAAGPAAGIAGTSSVKGGEGVYGGGTNSSVNTTGVFGWGTGNASGVYAKGGASNGPGLTALGQGTGPGVIGTGGSNGDGGSFTGAGTNGVGVYGLGPADGVYGVSNNTDGVHGMTTANSYSGMYGVDNSPSGGNGAWFQSEHGNGIQAYAGTGPLDKPGGIGLTTIGGAGGPPSPCNCAGTTGGTGIKVQGGQGGPPPDGGFPGNGGAGIEATAGPGVAGTTTHDGDAALLHGNVAVTRAPDNSGGNLGVIGNLKVLGTKNFMIDDPLDPANKVLVHAADESPQAENVYNGNATTDTRGYATVSMPRYFDAENTDPRYQLTVIGSFAEAIVWRKEEHNRFVVRTNKPLVEVSWQVSALRNDPTIRRLQQGPAEQPKPASERGRYLDPTAYGMPASLGIAQIPALATIPRPVRQQSPAQPPSPQQPLVPR